MVSFPIIEICRRKGPILEGLQLAPGMGGPYVRSGNVAISSVRSGWRPSGSESLQQVPPPPELQEGQRVPSQHPVPDKGVGEQIGVPAKPAAPQSRGRYEERA